MGETGFSAKVADNPFLVFLRCLGKTQERLLHLFNHLSENNNIRGNVVSNRYAPGYWGGLRQFEIPVSIIQDGQLVLKGSGLAMLLILAQSAKASRYRRSRLESCLEVWMTQKTLRERSGVSKDRITAGMRELETHKFIRRVSRRKQNGEFGAKAYQICNPADGEPLEVNGTNIYLNKAAYLRLPVCLIRETTADWSLSRLSRSEVRLYVVLCWLANRSRSGRFSTTASELKSLASLSTMPTMEKALTQLECKRLVSVGRSVGEYFVEMLDPYTGEPPHEETGDPRDNPANYKAVRSSGAENRLNLNAGSREQVIELLRSCLPEGDIMRDQSNGSVMILCPFHADRNPSCSVDPVGRGFNCFGCHKHGQFRELIAKLRGISPGESVAVIGRALGEEVVFREPDRNAEAIYSYHDANDKLVKQVVRYPDKRFAQRRPASEGGWIWNINGNRPILYNLMRVQLATIVCICEGEKDCDSFNSLSLHSAEGGDVVATTSGGADSWQDVLADELRGKRIILMPDDDEAGARFAENIAASLVQRGIEYRTVSFHDAGVKDLSDFLASGHGSEELVERVGRDWLSVTEPVLIGTPLVFEPA